MNRCFSLTDNNVCTLRSNTTQHNTSHQTTLLIAPTQRNNADIALTILAPI